MKHLGMLVTLLLLPSCGGSDGDVVKRDGEPDVLTVSADDSAINAAIEKARSTVATFQSALRSPPAGAESFSVKVAFRHPVGDGVEHIWLMEPSFSDGMIAGIVGNEPLHVLEVKLGQRVSAPVDRLSDWMYVHDGVLHGGYTIRALLERMPAEERAQALAAWGFRLE